MKRFLFCLCFLMSVVAAARAQSFSDKRILHYNLKHGLSFGIVNSICQDNRGFMWFATSDGLNRFDGSSFSVFKNEKGNPGSLRGNFIQSVFKDREGRLWISSREGLTQFDPQTSAFRNYSFSKESATGKNDVSHISQSKDGNLWVATSNNFYHFNPQGKKIVTYNNSSLEGLPSNSILNILEDSAGLLWLGTVNRGFVVYSVRNGRLISRQNISNPLGQVRVNNIYEDSQGDIWLATSGGLGRFNRKNNKVEVVHGHEFGLRSDIFLSIIEDSSNRHLVGLQDGGLYELQVQGDAPRAWVFKEVIAENGLPLTSRSVQTLFRDRDKNIWVGTYGNGLYMLSSTAEKFRKYQVKLRDESYIRFYGMCLDRFSNIWLGTDGSGIFKSSPEGKVLKHYKADGKPGSITDNAILSAFKDSRNRLWFGTYQRGLMLYSEASDSFRAFKHKAGDSKSLGANDVRVIYEDSAHRIWIGTNGGGLNLYNEAADSFESFTMSDSEISSDDVRSICQDAAGNLWVGTYGGGLNYFNTSTKVFTRALAKGVIPNNVVFALQLDKKGNLWIGSEGDGLIRYNTHNGETVVIDEKTGLANSTVNAIIAANDNQLWLSTNRGLSKVDKRTLSVVNYDSSDGLQAGQFHEGSALYDGKAQFMVFGGTEGWNIFNPSSVKQSAYKPKVLIAGLKLYGNQESTATGDGIRDISETKELVLNPDEAVFSLNYVMLNYAYPSEGEYAYMLEGLDKDWNFVKGQRSATYRYLQPGSYTFKVKAANHDGVWSDDYSSIKIVILPPWYKTWWAYLLYFSTLAGAVIWFIRYRTEQARLKYEVRTAHFEAEKEKELHKKKVDFFTNISHEFRTPLTLIINPLKEMLYEEKKESDPASLNIVYRNARRLLSLVDQLLLFRKSEGEGARLKVVRLNLHSLCREVFLCFSNQARSQGVNLEFSAAMEELWVYGDREKLEIVLFNLISNALKYTPENGRITVSLRETPEELLIDVTDTGSGIPPEVGDKLFDQFYQANAGGPSKGGFGIGLSLVRNFLQLHSGKISYSSKPAGGTTFTVLLQKGKEHFAAETIFEDVTESSVFLEELLEDFEGKGTPVDEPVMKEADLYTEIKTILVVDDNAQIRTYVKQLFAKEFEVLEADNGTTGLELIRANMPDVVISDVMMQGISGIELCSRVKEDPALSHIPVILLTASSSLEVKLKGIECGADDYVSKPFEKEILVARVSGILKTRNNLQRYFYNQITLQPDNTRISAEYKQFLDRCIEIVENHLTDTDFGIKKLSDEIGMSRSNLYLKIKSVSGQSGNAFIRSIRLRKAAEIFVSTDSNISETAYMVGIRDMKYFREQFHKLFGMNPSEYIKRYRKPFNANHVVKRDINSKSQ